MTYHCAGCGESGIAPGVCDRCHHEYLPDDHGLTASLPRQIHRRPWRHFVTANATTAFTDIYVDDRWLDGANLLSKVGSFLVLGFLLLQPLLLIPVGYRILLAALTYGWLFATVVLHAVLWTLLSARFGASCYRVFAAVAMSERAIRASPRFMPISAVAEGSAVLVGETTPVETVSREGGDQVLAVQGFAATGTRADDPDFQYDGSGSRLRPSIGGDFSLTDESGASIFIRAEHVVIESPRLDLSIPVGSRVAASGNAVWVPGEEGYRGGHGRWEMVGTWDQPIILRMLREGSPPSVAPTGVRLEAPTDATTQADDASAAPPTVDREAAAHRR